MIKVLPMLETYMMAGIVTGELMGTDNPLKALLGDLNPNAPAGSLTGPAGTGVLTLKELLSGSADSMVSTTVNVGGKTKTGTMYSATGGSPIDIIAQNFQDNWLNIAYRTALTTAGFRVANKVLAKPKNKINKMIRQAGFGSTVQI